VSLAGELTALPQTPSWILGHTSKGGRGGEERGEKGGDPVEWLTLPCPKS